MTRMLRFTMVSVFTVALGGYGVAHAQDEGNPCGGEGNPCGGGEGGEGGEGGGDAGGGGDMGGGDAGGGDMAAAGDMGGGAPPMLLMKGKLGVNVALNVNLSKEFTAKPISLAPDVWYGVSDKLNVGLAHSAYGLAGWWGQIGGGVCFAGKKDFGGGVEVDMCGGKAYNGPIGVLAHFLLAQGGMDLAADGGLVIRVLDPMYLGIKAGVMGRKMMGKLMISFNPNIYIGATKRDEGNKEYINVPVSVGFMASPKLHAGVQTGIQGPLDHFGDFYSIPLALGAIFQVNPTLGVGGAFTLFRVAGFEGPGAADLRGLSIFAMWHN